LVFQFVDEPLCRPYPFLSPSAQDKAEALEQLVAFGVQRVNGAMHLVQHEVAEKVFNAQAKRGLGVALPAVGLVDEDAQTGALVEAVVVVNVDAADGLSALGQVDHQTELLVGLQVVVGQQELLDLEARVGGVSPAHAPNVAVVLPAVDKLCIFRLGRAQRYRFVFDEHLLQFVENSSFVGRLARILIAFIRQNFRQKYAFWCNKGRKMALMRL